MALAATWIGGTSSAEAHGLDGPPHAQNALFVDGELVAVPTNFGLLTADGEDWLWTPEELVRGVVATSNIIAGRPTVGTTDGLYSTEDAGCTWTGPSELVGSSVLAIEVAGDDVWVGTEAASRPSGLYVSRDGGASFEPGELYGPGIRVGGVKRGESVTWAIVFDANVVEWQLWRDDGVGFARLEIEPVDRLRLFAVEGDVALLGVAVDDAWRLETRDATGVLESWAIDAEPIDAEFHSFEGPSPPYITPEAQLLAPGGVIDTETYCVIGEIRCRSVDGFGGALWRERDPLVLWASIVPAECEDPEAAEQVRLYWPIANAAGYGVREDDSRICLPAEGVSCDQREPEGCCAQVRAPPSNPLWSLLILAMLMRRLQTAKMSRTRAQEQQ